MGKISAVHLNFWCFTLITIVTTSGIRSGTGGGGGEGAGGRLPPLTSPPHGNFKSQAPKFPGDVSVGSYCMASYGVWCGAAPTAPTLVRTGGGGEF